MNRRKFLQLANTIVLGATGAAFLSLPAPLSRRTEYLDEIDPNYRAWREAQIEIVKQGYTLRWASLERPVGGFRRARVYVTDDTSNDLTLTWLQPWRGQDV